MRNVNCYLIECFFHVIKSVIPVLLGGYYSYYHPYLRDEKTIWRKSFMGIENSKYRGPEVVPF